MKINFIGTIMNSTGYDIHCKSLVNALYELNPDIKLEVPLPPNWMRFVNDAELNMITKEPRKADVNIAVTQPQFWKLYMDNCDKFVGFLVFEGSSIPKYWIEYLLDEKVTQIWVPSEHTKEAILNTTNNKKIIDKIRIVPHGVDLNIFKPQRRGSSVRSEHCPDVAEVAGSNPAPFTFICNKGWRGGMEDRGGVGYVLKAYCEEFGKDEPVSLLLKLNSSYLNPQLLKQKLDELNLPKDRPEIKVNIDNMPHKDIPKLYCEGDVYVCAQRADSFDLGTAEGMACGLPVLTSGYGGQIEHMKENENALFFDYKLEEVKGDINYEGVNWCIPDIKDIKKKMRWSFENQNKIKEMGKNAQEFISKNFAWRMSAKKALNFLNEIKQ